MTLVDDNPAVLDVALPRLDSQPGQLLELAGRFPAVLPSLTEALQVLL